MLALPTLARAQAVKQADLVGAWQAEVELADQKEKLQAWMVLWPDGLWWYGGDLMWHRHGGARWRLVGDTLWLGNDYAPYFHPMIHTRIDALREKGYSDLGTMDMDIIKQREPFDVPDSIYWSQAFRDTTSACAGSNPCGTWVYKVSVQDQQISLVRLDSLSRATKTVATKAVLKRNALVNCQWSGHECP